MSIYNTRSNETSIKWTAEDSEYVLASFPSQSTEQIAARLHRSKSSVVGKIASFQRVGKLPYQDGTRKITTEEQKKKLRDVIVSMAASCGVITVEMTRTHPTLVGYMGNDVNSACWHLVRTKVLTFDEKNSLRLRAVST